MSAQLFQSESTLNCACLIILTYIAVYNCDTHAHVSSASVSNVGMPFVMLIIKRHLHLEIAIWKFLNNGYGKYPNLRSIKSLNVAENVSANSVKEAENDWIDWQFSVCLALLGTILPCLVYIYSSIIVYKIICCGVSARHF